MWHTPRHMDLVTQACLGGALGELVLGRKLGVRGACWGAALGVLPDADSLLAPLLSDLQELTWHRSLTHSLLFVLGAAPLFGLGLQRCYQEQTERRDWILLTLLVLGTHVLLDCCTTFGTQVLWPFSSRPISFRSVSVVDPLVTLPLLVAVVGCPFLARDGRRRRWLNRAALGFAALYLLALVGVKAHVDRVHDETLAGEGFAARRTLSKPTMGNGLLWRLVAEDEGGYRVGYYSLLDGQRRVEEIRYVPRGSLGEHGRDPEVQRLLEVLDDYYAVQSEPDGGLVVQDVRYGQWQGWSAVETPYVFGYRLAPPGSGRRSVTAIPRPEAPPDLRRSFKERIRGRR
jgi:inner membrane protein